jgi:hypothetical protein
LGLVGNWGTGSFDRPLSPELFTREWEVGSLQELEMMIKGMHGRRRRRRDGFVNQLGAEETGVGRRELESRKWEVRGGLVCASVGGEAGLRHPRSVIASLLDEWRLFDLTGGNGKSR